AAIAMYTAHIPLTLQLSGSTSETLVLPFFITWTVFAIPFGLALRRIRANHLVTVGSALLAAASLPMALSVSAPAATGTCFAIAGVGTAMFLLNSLFCSQAPFLIPSDTDGIAPQVALRASATAGTLPVYAFRLGSATLQAFFLGSLAASMRPPNHAPPLYLVVLATLFAAASFLASFAVPRTPLDRKLAA
ncbi:hypothetical protein HK405_015167, partial [Cladochytrium tenue]